MIHLYCGGGKGKTTAAMGLALRALGRGRRVAVCQFLKSENSGERLILEQLEGAILLPLPEKMKFVFRMTPEEKKLAAEQTAVLFRRAAELARRGECQMLVLDELCGALSVGLLELGEVLAFLDEVPEVEVVLTGRDPCEALRARAHYLTEMTPHKHPFDTGLPAREGVEW